MTVFSYARTSLVEQTDQGEQLQEQLERESLRLHTYALRVGLKVEVPVIDRDVLWSIELNKRPGWKYLLDRVDTGDIIITCTMERMFSSTEDVFNALKILRKRKVRLYVVDLESEITNPHYSPQFEKVVKVFQGLEKRRSTERVKTVKQRQRDEGRFLGGSRPFGYTVHSNGRLIENPMEQKVLRRILKMNQEGKSLRAISAEVSSPVMPISFKTVQRLIKRHQELAEEIRRAEF
jgi:DNA invertase Pin-like site-specific DNA recombinase